MMSCLRWCVLVVIFSCFDVRQSHAEEPGLLHLTDREPIAIKLHRPAPKKSLNHLIKYIEYQDATFLKVFFEPAPENSPALLLYYTEDPDKMEKPIPWDFYLSGESPMQNQSAVLTAGHIYEYIMVSVWMYLVPSANCKGVNYTEDCVAVDNWQDYANFTDFFEYAERHYLVEGPNLTVNQRVDQEESQQYSLVIKPYEEDDFWSFRFMLEEHVLCYKIDEQIIVDGKNITDWKMIYEGKQTTKFLDHIEESGTRNYTARMCICDDDDFYRPLQWTERSAPVTIDFDLPVFTAPREVATTPLPDVEATTTLQPSHENSHRSLIFSIALVVAAVLVPALLCGSYYVCYKKLGLCRRINGGIPKPKLFISTINRNPSDPLEEGEVLKPIDAKEKAVDSATPVVREELLQNYCRCAEEEANEATSSEDTKETPCFDGYLQDTKELSGNGAYIKDSILS